MQCRLTEAVGTYGEGNWAEILGDPEYSRVVSFLYIYTVSAIIPSVISARLLLGSRRRFPFHHVSLWLPKVDNV